MSLLSVLFVCLIMSFSSLNIYAMDVRAVCVYLLLFSLFFFSRNASVSLPFISPFFFLFVCISFSFSTFPFSIVPFYLLPLYARYSLLFCNIHFIFYISCHYVSFKSHFDFSVSALF